MIYKNTHTHKTHIRTHAHTRTHTRIRTRIRTHIRTYHTQTHLHTRTSYTRTHTHAHMHTRTHAQNTNTHTHTYTHVQNALMQNVTFASFCGEIFKKFRARCGLSEEADYHEEICITNEHYLEFISNSKSGQSFFLT